MPRVANLEGWATDLHAAVEGLPRGTFTAARSLARHLLKVAKRTAPRHTGALRTSLRTVARERAGVVEVALTSEDPAAGIQQTGGVIRMRTKRMAVPIGVERAYWDASKTRREPREIAGLFKITARNGRQYLVTREGKNLVLRFALRTQVTMPAQYWATNAIEEAGKGLDERATTAYVSQLLATSRSGGL